MKAVLAIILVAAVFQSSVEAQGLFEQAQQYGRILSAITSIHSALSKTPLKHFLPGPVQIATQTMNAIRQASNLQQGIQKATENFNNIIKKAAEQAKLPNVDISKLTSQFQDNFSQAMKQVGSTGPNAN